MKQIGIHVFFLFWITTFFGQNIEFQETKVDYKISYENLKVNSEPNLGFLGIGANLHIFEKVPNLYLSLNSYSTITGYRPGLITIGMGAGYEQKIANSPWMLDAGFFVGGGATDGGGLVTRLHLNLNYRFKNVSVFAGYSRLDFPTGNLGNNNFNIGLTLHSLFNFGHRTDKNDFNLNNYLISDTKLRISVLGLQYFNFIDGPLKNNKLHDSKNIRLIGVGFDKFINSNLYATLKLNGAVTDGVDGYMSILFGLGFEQPLLGDKLSLDAQIIGGPSGGGAVATGGGSLLQGSIGLRTTLGKHIQLKAALGQSYAPDGNLNGSFLEFSLAKKFDFLKPESNFYTLTDQDNEHQFGIGISNKTYFSNNALDKNGQLYDKTFKLIGFQMTKKLSKRFDLVGSTYWAYQGSYGAYAEGLLGLQYNVPVAKRFQFDAQILAGAAGGGGIDLGSGLIYQYSLGASKAINSNFNVGLQVGQMRGFEGNFKPTFMNIGLNYKFSQITKK